MDLETLRLLVDFGLMILVQLVQWIIYPSLERMKPNTLADWHGPYAGRITIWVLPLMFGQYIILALQLMEEFKWLHLFSAVLVLYSSYLTFFKAVPLHHQIAQDDIKVDTFRKLLSCNLKRTIAWSLVFLLGLIEFMGVYS